MADTFVPITFVADELLTSTKMNQLAANQANFHNGTGLGDGSINNRHLANTAVKDINIDFSTFSAITLKQGANQTISATTTDVIFNTIDTVSGTKLTRSGNRVVIGAGVTKVRVTYKIMADSSSGASYLFTGIMKNTARVSNQIDAIVNGQYASTSESTILGVTTGDAIGVAADCGAGSMVLSVSRLCNLIVEVTG